MQTSLKKFSALPEVTKRAYIPAHKIAALDTFGDDLLFAVHAPVGCSCEIPHPEDALRDPLCRYQIFIRGMKDGQTPKVRQDSNAPFVTCLPARPPACLPALRCTR